MKKQLTFLLLTISCVFLLAFVLFVFNQIAQAYLLARTVGPVFGQMVLWSLIVLFLGLIAAPVILFYRLPKPLSPPTNEAELPVYRQKLSRRLATNRLLIGSSFDYNSEAGLQQALSTLHTRADDIVRTTAKSVFLTTAISQNGKLDALTVLLTHTKMIWDVAHVYYQRPAPRDLIHLYSNVAATTLLATQIEDLDVSEQLEPVIGTVLQNSALKSVPFVGQVSSVVVDSLLEGTVNAFLTLRVGVITKRYCSAMEPFHAKQARRAAYREAAILLRAIVVQTSGQVASGIFKAAAKAGSDSVKSGVESVGQATVRARNVLTRLFRRPGSSATGTP